MSEPGDLSRALEKLEAQMRSPALLSSFVPVPNGRTVRELRVPVGVRRSHERVSCSRKGQVMTKEQIEDRATALCRLQSGQRIW